MSRNPGISENTGGEPLFRNRAVMSTRGALISQLAATCVTYRNGRGAREGLEEETTPRLVAARSRIKVALNHAGVHRRVRVSGIFNYHARSTPTTCGTCIRVFGDVLRTRPGKRNTPRGRDETTPGTDDVDDDSYLQQPSRHCIQTRRYRSSRPRISVQPLM